MKKITVPLLLLATFLLVSCTQFGAFIKREAAAEKKRVCKRNAAYAAGVNDGRENRPMQADYAEICDANQYHLNAAYERGYRVGLRSRPKVQININDKR